MYPIIAENIGVIVPVFTLDLKNVLFFNSLRCSVGYTASIRYYSNF